MFQFQTELGERNINWPPAGNTTPGLASKPWRCSIKGWWAGQGLASYPGVQSLMDYLESSSASYAPVQSMGTLSSFTSGGTPFLVNAPKSYRWAGS